MSYSLSVWLDDKTARALELLYKNGERKRGDMVKILIRRAARELSIVEQNEPMNISTNNNLDIKHSF